MPWDAQPGGLLEDGRSLRAVRRFVRFSDPAVQHHDLDGPADAQHPAVVRAVRARGHRRTYPRQDCRQQGQGPMDGRCAAAGLRRR
jgi:hypothetical protein